MELSRALSNDIKSTPFFCRPLALLSFLFVFGVFLVQAHLLLFAVYAAVVLGACVRLLIFTPKDKRFKSIFAYLMLAALLLSSLITLPGFFNYKKVTGLEGEREVEAVISRVYYEESFGSAYRAELVSIDGVSCSGMIDISADFAIELSEYDTLHMKAVLSDARKSLSGGELLNAVSNDLCANAEVLEVINVTDRAKGGILYHVDMLRSTLSNYFSDLLSDESGGYASALILGEKSGLSDEFKYDMSALGVSHVLAVSGMHMSIIALFVIFLVERASYSRKTKSVVVIAVSVLFMGVAGFSVSVIRSAIMLIISMLAVFFRGRSDSLTSLFLSGAIICAIEPQYAISCSFLLSFTATLGIILCASYAQVRARESLYASKVGDMRLVFRCIRWVAFSLLVTLCASLFTLPVLSLYFDQASFFAIVMNFIACPAAFVSLILAILILGFGMIPFVGAALCFVFEWIYGAFSDIAHLLSSSFDTSVSLRYPFFAVCVVALASVLVFMWLKCVRNPLAVLSVFILFAITYGTGIQIYSALNANRAEITYYADKNSEGFVVNSGEQTVYIDVGNGSKGLYKTALDDVIDRYYQSALDGYVITHYHSRHISTVMNVLEGASPKTLYLPYPKTGSEQSFYEDIIKQLPEKYGPEIIMYERGDTIKIGRISVESAPFSLIERSTHPIMMFRFSVNDISLAYVGASVFESAELISAQTFVSKSSAVIVGDHGPKSKVSFGFFGDLAGKKIYLSPYEDIDEATAFKTAVCTRINSCDDVAKAFFDLS